jgi:hypothetical protein
MIWVMRCINKRKQVKKKNIKKLICNENIYDQYLIYHYEDCYEEIKVFFFVLFYLEYTYNSYPIAATIKTLTIDIAIT